MKYNLETLLDRINCGEKPSYVYFWGHICDPGVIDETCMSQWFDSEFTVDGVVYKTAEQYMMAQKARLFNDETVFSQIMASNDPAEYKVLGRMVKSFDAAQWDAAKYDIVRRGNLEKFKQNPKLRAYLDSTGDSVLVEASPEDGIWGVMLGMEDPRIDNPTQWRGENLLGFALMEVRDEIRRK